MAAAKKTRKSKGKREELAGQADPRAPLDSAALLAAAKPVLQRLEEDLQARATASPAVTAALTARYEAEKAAQRTAESFAGWTSALATQVAAAWLLSCVFVRTLEDRGLLKQNRLAGPGAEDSQKQFFQLAPSLTERDYLLTVFRELARHPAAAALFDAEHSLVWKLSPSAEVAKELLALFRTPTASEPAFRFGQASTRFLGDLYQDLSEDVRKRYALLQTPDFVEAYILDHTLEPAIKRFGLDDTTLIDPTCGSGHFLLGAFDRLFEHRLRAEPGSDARVAATRALDCVYGADINPYAVAIARFRLTLAFLEKAGYAKLADAPTLPLHVVVADSLRLNPQHPQQELWQHAGVGAATRWLGDVFAFDDETAAKEVLGRQYAAVVGNPPYITVKDSAVREVYRAMYIAAAGKYALSAPFCERIFQLARSRGYTGQITANSFMKREFGKRLIEEYLPKVNLERIINTSGAFIPGHGTPTVLLFGTNDLPQGAEVHAVLAKRGEPSTPDDPSQGLVWRSLVEHGGEVGFENDYISIARVARDALTKHPWSLGGGGASELKELLEERAATRLAELVDTVGVMAIAGSDDAFVAPRHVFERFGLTSRRFAVGESIRDWSIDCEEDVLFPYTKDWTPQLDKNTLVWLWPYRAVLRERLMFGKTQVEAGLQWFEYRHFGKEKVKVPLGIGLAFVSTHNHFAFTRGSEVFKQTAPIIKLPESATEDDHLALLAYLNSSTACFWMKQVFSPKGMHNGSASNATPFLVRFEFDGTKLLRLPIPPGVVGERRATYIQLARRMDALARERASVHLAPHLEVVASAAHIEAAYLEHLERRRALLRKLVALQEEIDWLVYADFGLAPDSTLHADECETDLGSRAFEVGQHQASSPDIADWFRWNETQPMRPNPALERIVTARVEAIDSAQSELGVLERGEFKRRWVQPAGKAAQFLETDDKVLEGHVQNWIPTRLEQHVCSVSDVVSWRDLSAVIGRDQQLLAAHEWLFARKRISASLKELMAANSVPFVAAARYSTSGIDTYNQWLETWDAQRAEDQGDRSHVKLPPKFGPDDFEGEAVRHRGPLDVPKERFISYPYCESDQDEEPIYGWAGWDHLQRARALAALYLRRKDGEGWARERLIPILAGLLELIPWVKQWHNEPSAEFGGLQMGDYFEQFLDGECRQHSLTRDDLRAWRPPKKTRGAATKSKRKRDDTSTDVAAHATGADSDEAAPKSKKSRSKKKPATAAAEAAPTEAE